MESLKTYYYYKAKILKSTLGQCTRSVLVLVSEDGSVCVTAADQPGGTTLLNVVTVTADRMVTADG
ncbi:hypothetical protein E2C01_024726 [Portunus trituberculatus]|uniref:Uncharacterized protein n=1 Tax=Portunus trituberculatus TaxID=210409 RepID=A0A5B7EDN9_PORTR|nr:hypothetical protein [Portunus trituberculatus]